MEVEETIVLFGRCNLEVLFEGNRNIIFFRIGNYVRDEAFYNLHEEGELQGS